MNGWTSLVAAAGAPIAAPPFHTGYAPNPPAHQLAPFLFDLPGEGVVDRDAALTIPAYTRGRALIAGTVASFPIEEWRGGERLGPRPLLVQPSRATTRAMTLRSLVEDLIDDGRAWWLVVERDDTGHPKHVEHIDTARVTVDDVGRVILDADTPARSMPPARDLIRFDHDRHGTIAKGARILATALALERAARLYAANPAPRTVLRGQGPVHLTGPEAAELLDEYETTVKRRGAAYVDQVELDQVGWSSSELQLVEARRHTSAQIASLLNLDVTWLGASEPGSALTYTNRTDLYRGLVDLTLRSYLDTIEQRLSLDDVTERGRVVRWNLDGFLRGNTGERTDVVTKLYAAQLVDRDEARRMLDLSPDVEVTP